MSSIFRVVVVWFVVCIICGHFLIPPTGGSALVKVLLSGAWPSITFRAHVLASSLYVTPVRDVTLPICMV